MTKYTFTFDADSEPKFRNVLSRLDPSEYVVLEDILPVDKDAPKTSDRTTIMEMDAEAALTFRLGMKAVTIRRDRTEEELAEEKINEDRHKIKITVVVPNTP